MSTLALVFHRDGRRVDSAIIRRVLAPITSRGPDGVDYHTDGAVGVGHCHFWTTPQEVGVRQPITDSENGFVVAFDGRLDNRRVLLRALGLGGANYRDISDAELLLHSYKEWRDSCFERLIGPFAVAVVDVTRNRVVIARDALGSRPLYYHLTHRLLVVASEEQAILAHPDVHDWLDDVTLARYFAVREVADERTNFVEVSELPPAHSMTIGATDARQRRYWRIDPGRVLRYSCDDHYAEHFREVLDQAVVDRIRSHGPPAVMMSGGLDSTSVAALASRRLNAAGIQLRSMSYVFDELDECDERTYIAPTVVECGLDAHLVPGDDCWPLSEVEGWHYNPNGPHEIPYRRLIDSLLATCGDTGSRVLLTGTFADELYTGLEQWLADLLSDSSFALAAREVIRHLGLGRDGGTVLRESTRQAISRPIRRLRSTDPTPPEPAGWLTSYGSARLSEPRDETMWGDLSSARRPEQIEQALGAQAARGAVFRLYHANRFGVETRQPYRDRRLVELMLALPAHQLYNRGDTKIVLRNAMQGILPESVRTRRETTTLVPLYYRGMVEREARLVRALIADPDALWRAFVREDWLLSHLPEVVDPSDDPVGAAAVWRCVAAELWWRRRQGLSLPEVAPREAALAYSTV